MSFARAALTTFTTLVIAVGFLTLAPRHAGAQKKSRDLLLHDEIEASAQREADLFTALRSLRPHFIEVAPGQVSFGSTPVMRAIVYIDGRREPSVDGLHSIRAIDVDEVRYLDPSRASIEYGPSAGGGAVVIKLRKGAQVNAPRPDTAGVVQVGPLRG